MTRRERRELQRRQELERRQALPPGAEGQIYMERRQEFRTGPLPDAQELAAYKSIDEDLFAAISEDFRKNGEHARAMERDRLALDAKVIPRLVFLDGLGLVLSTIVALAALGAITCALIEGSTTAGIGAAVTGVLLALPGIMRVARRVVAQREASEEKAQ